MGRQSNKNQKRSRRKAYIKRRKVAVKAKKKTKPAAA